MKTADTRGSTPNSNEPPNGTIDQRRLMFYSGSWQLLEERIDDTFSGGSFSENRRVQYIWGIRGSDDIVLRRADTNFSGTTANYDKQFYHLTDTQFSTIVILDETAKELERITYDAYGRPIHHQPAGDLTGSGFVVVADAELWTGRVPTLSNGGRGTIFDLNRDGSVDEGDRAIINANMGQGLPWGALSFGWIDNHLGFAGYHYHPEMRVYLARHRWFDPELGRWLQRDPAGYVDGMNLYLYGLGSPYVFVDPMGLWSDPCVSWNRGVGHWLARLLGFESPEQAVVLTAEAVGELALEATAHAIQEGMKSQIQKDLDFIEKVIAIEHNATGGNMTATGVIATALAEKTGMQRVAEGVAGIDMATSALLDGTDRASRILTGSGQGLLITAGGTALTSPLLSTLRTTTAGSAALPEGSFSISNWSGYPAGMPKPTGPFRLLQGQEYNVARAAANQANRAIHQASPSLRGMQIHEIQPVKFGGNPTSFSNKISLTPTQHAPVTSWWNQLQRNIQSGP